MARSNRSGADGVVAHTATLRVSDHPVRSVQRWLRGILLMSRPPLLCKEGNMLVHTFGSSEPSGDVVFGFSHYGRCKDSFRLIEFDEPPVEEETCFIRYACGLLHVMGHHDNRVALLQVIDQFLDFC